MTSDSTPSQVPAAAGPTTSARAPVPIWLVILLFLLLYWAMIYFDQRAGWFDQRVYSPYRSAEQLIAFQPVGGADDFLRHGQQLFHNNCAVCHMDAGTGNPANGCPPLMGSEWVAAKGPGRIIRLVSKGGQGDIEVLGKTYNGTMLAIGDQLPGSEKEKAESIAAIISYVRHTFGNKASAVTPEKVQQIREQIKDHSANYTPAELKSAPED